MTKARNGIRYTAPVKQQAKLLRADGMTHREIAKKLGTSVSIAHQWTKEIQISKSQKQAIKNRRNRHRMSAIEKKRAGERLAPYQYKLKYSDENLLDKIRAFHAQNGRIPLKREFNALHIYSVRFGSWNKAVKKAGFETNPVLFSKRFIAIDGHVCDSFTEKVIDDWLTSKNIVHERNVRYGNTRFTTDFRTGTNIFIEFFGLAGAQKKYDQNIERKRLLAKELNYRLIEVYPDDIYPKNKLLALLKDCR